MKRGDIAFIGVAAVIAAILLFAGCVKPQPNNPPVAIDSANLKSFASWDEISSFAASTGYGRNYYGDAMFARTGMATFAPSMSKGAESQGAGSAGASDYSKTNVQVEGVDEADIVKNDGKYIYAVTGSGYGYYGGATGKVAIINAYPASQMNIVSQIETDGSVQQIFIYKDELVVFGSAYKNDVAPPAPPEGCARCVMPPYYSQNFAFMKIYDVSDRASPKLVKEISAKGNYKDSRMIGGKVYAIFNDWIDQSYPVPLYLVDGVSRKVSASDIKYFDSPDENYEFDTFIGVDLGDLKKEETRKIVMMGAGQNLFVSAENMYVTYTRYDRYSPQWKAYEETYWNLMPEATKAAISQIDATNISDWRRDRLKVAEAQSFVSSYLYNESRKDILSAAQKALLEAQFNQKTEAIRAGYQPGSEKTVINKISLDGFAYLAQGEAPGHALNQFSMDEYNSHFRIATTSGQLSGGWGRMMPGGEAVPSSTNAVYVLDSNLDISGSLEGLAPGEKIYSARFMGNRLYLVTFKKVDPLFVIDLANPSKPKLLGKLKIPGYSDYLHPYDENYVIGIGKGAVAAEEGDFAWYQGVKLSLFDVRDVNNPKEAAMVEIGDRGTDSYALQDHKAFLFDKQKNLLVIPITLAKIDRSKYAGELPANAYGDAVFQGAYVFGITPQGGFQLRGTITHASGDELQKSGEYFQSQANVKRSLYIGNSLYTVSDEYVKANDLSTLSALSSVQISEGNTYPPRYYQ